MQKFITKCLYIPMLEEFKIIDVFEVYETNLTEVKPNVLELFLTEHKERVRLVLFRLVRRISISLQPSIPTYSART